MVLNQIFDRQVFNYYHLVFTYQLSRQLMEKVFSTVTNSRVYPCYFLPLFVSIVRSFLFARQRFLDLLKFGVQLFKVLGIDNFVSIASSNQAGYTHIETNSFIGQWQWVNGLIYKQGNVPAATSIQLDSYCGWVASLGQLSTPANRQCFTALGKPNLPVLPLKSRFSKLSACSKAYRRSPPVKLARAEFMLFLEIGVFCSSCKEVAKCFLQMSKSLLQRHRANFI